MKNFSKNKYSSNQKRNSIDRQKMHSAVCVTCNKKCEVPFRPTGNKPIYCSSCFEKEGVSSINIRNKDNKDNNKEAKRMFSAICTDCGIRCEVPFRPTGNKPIYCSGCFESIGSNRSGGFKKINKTDSGLNITLIENQLISINSKLQEILLAIKPEKNNIIKKDKKTKEKKQLDKNDLKKILIKIKDKKKIKKDNIKK